jgi:Xaa-Pro dipeptidase
MTWTPEEIKNHRLAANRLGKIINDVAFFIKQENSTSEYDVQAFILKKYKEYDLKSRLKPIVAFNKNTSFVHYFPGKKSKKLRDNTLILVDIWSGLEKAHAPFADITWMFYFGNKVPVQIKKIFTLVIAARNKALMVINKNLKNKKLLTGRAIDTATRSVMGKYGLEKNFLHGTGHPLGFNDAHGRGRRINRKGRKEIFRHVAYTIEPGVYIKNKYGVRSEIDFYITDKYKLIITTPVQKSIMLIKPYKKNTEVL